MIRILRAAGEGFIMGSSLLGELGVLGSSGKVLVSSFLHCCRRPKSGDVGLPRWAMTGEIIDILCR